jgi:hypothetical protein
VVATSLSPENHPQLLLWCTVFASPFSYILLRYDQEAQPGSDFEKEEGAMTVYEICVKGHLDQHWSAWFDGMAITNNAHGNTIISGQVDQAALHTLLIKVYNLNLTLISVLRIETDETS